MKEISLINKEIIIISQKMKLFFFKFILTTLKARE